MEDASSFGVWLRRRRRELDLTQQQLAGCAACSTVTIRKFEAGERRPSRQLAELLADCLRIPAAQRESFVAFARGLQPHFDLTHLAAESVTAVRAARPVQPVPLPVPPTPFIGRTAELAQVAARLADPSCRLLTLVGPGGMGKTRLALAAAARTDHFADGVAFVALTSAADVATVPQSIAHALNISLSGGADPAIQLSYFLQDKNLLLVLDNFESVLDAADLLAHWLQSAPGCKWLVTSRERLNLAEEWLLPVQGFDSAEAGMALYSQIASRVQPAFVLAEEAETVTQICSYVDGMPLAIELAAGWAASLPSEEILARLQEAFDFLSSSLRNVPQRHRSLRHLFDQSWQLLAPAEQAVLMKLSVFRGGFTLEAAERVAGATTFLLQALTGKSLLLSDDHGRYDLHELTRQYAAEKLRASGEEGVARQRHGQLFLALAEEFDRERGGRDGVSWFQRLEVERDNLRAANDWLNIAGPGEEALRLANALWWFWFRRGYWTEAEHVLDRALGSGDMAGDVHRCQALLNLSTIIALQGRYAEAAPYLMEAMQLARRLDNPVITAGALTVLGQALPDRDESIAVFVEAMALLERERGQRAQEMLALLGNLLGERLHENGRYGEASAYYQQSLQLYRQRGNVDLVSYPLGNLGRLALHDGRLEEAGELFGEAIALSRAIGNRQGVADWLLPLAKLNLYRGDTEPAAAFLRESLVLHREMNNKQGEAVTSAWLAWTALAAGDTPAAQRHLDASLQTFAGMVEQMRHSGNALAATADRITPDFLDCLAIAGVVAAAQLQYEQATFLMVCAGRLGQPLAHRPDPPLQQQIDATLEAARRHLPHFVYEEIRAVAGAAPLEEIFRQALGATKRPAE